MNMTASNMAATNAAVAASNAQQQAITAQRAMGPIVTVEPDVWLDIAATGSNRVVVHSTTGGKLWVSLKHRYLIAAHGLYFATTHTEPLNLPNDFVVIEAKVIYTP